ncbi:MAG TPA: pyruvate:ferredoxin (flavodoxin) oxidoreductase [Candidatus Ornithomonoglobus intestinigallinarum]|uniref:Pyruvate:ferredoxin oxidoreductase n=1 Tax=Candidatus Ornithomonoglobus intestinigallinarum TaxID=2840894 RepID=A0A9D1KQD2_9FIRM|nr:pyruvate:ferredoxin (flavodoxin) oxidoreductase [Candidatus Ornithomonoglobus intestinigallinarum]
MARKMKTMDGNNAAAYASYAFTDVAAIYPITPSSTMAEVTDKWAAAGMKNIFGQPVKVVEMQSEAGASGTVHGSLTAGALTTTYTASQGLLLMIPNMYKIAGELLPCVFNVSARTLASHALSIFGDHQDVMACRQTGFAMLASSSPQEAMDLGAVAHLTTIKSRVPFLHFFDGFRTSHEYQKVACWDYNDLAEMVDWDALAAFRHGSLNPEHPAQRGTAQNGDIFFQAKEAVNKYYEAVPEITQEYMDKVNAKIGTDYKLFNYYGADDAEHIIVAMGSVTDTIEETIDYLNANGGKYGMIRVRLYRPFSIKHFTEAIPSTVKTITVLDRTKESGAVGEPLYLDVVSAVSEAGLNVKVLGGRYGLASKDTTPGQIIAAFKNETKNHFTIGIVDDVTGHSLEITENPDTTPEGITSCKFWGLGADGTVGANKNSVKIIGDHTDMNVQAYFDYDSKKSGGLTCSHLRFGHPKITSTYLISKADFVACHKASYIRTYDMVQDVKPGGVFLLNCSWGPEELEEHLPGQVKRYIAENNIRFYTIDGVKIGKEIGLGNRINTVLQSAFFTLANIIPEADAIQYMKDAATASYSKKGDAIVKMNHDAIDAGAQQIVKVDVPESWKNAEDEDISMKFDGEGELIDYVNSVLGPVSQFNGAKLPVSTFVPYVNGQVPLGSSAFEKRGIAIDVPVWNADTCVQCGNCAYVCPHACIRPVVLTKEELDNAPEGIKYKNAMMLDGLYYTMAISVLDCTGCGSCANVCPSNKKNPTLVMQPLDTQLHEQANYDYAAALGEKQAVLDKFPPTKVKGSQFKKPYLEFSGACAGCGETPYAKLVTQLFGDRMFIANATGCSSIWGGSAPSTPYCADENGHGPAWANSLFEDNAEYGYGMFLAQNTLRERNIEKLEKIAEENADVKPAVDKFIETKNDAAANKVATDELLKAIANLSSQEAKDVLADKEFLSKKSCWIFGGDGWAYDIGFGGVDHVLASGEDVNVLVFDTEVYSNTGGQSSKSTPTGAIAQFAAAGKETKKKDLAAIAMTYGYVYVAQIAQGANPQQCLNAIIEAESYNGPSLIIAYAPCINHGIKGGMSIAQTEEKKAVDAGYWHLFRFDPRRTLEGKNPFQLDSKAPTADYDDFIMGEVRYNSLARSNPERAKELFAKAKKNAEEKYAKLVKMASEE